MGQHIIFMNNPREAPCPGFQSSSLVHPRPVPACPSPSEGTTLQRRGRKDADYVSNRTEQRLESRTVAFAHGAVKDVDGVPGLQEHYQKRE